MAKLAPTKGPHHLKVLNAPSNFTLLLWQHSIAFTQFRRTLGLKVILLLPRMMTTGITFNGRQLFGFLFLVLFLG